MLWDFVLWDFVLWDFVRRDFVQWDSVPDSTSTYVITLMFTSEVMMPLCRRGDCFGGNMNMVVYLRH